MRTLSSQKLLKLGTILSLGLFCSIAMTDENKKVTKIYSTSSANGKSNVSKELLEECILSLPAANKLEADVKRKTQFLKGINGDKSKKDHMDTYEATIEINYMLYQKELIVITTNSIESSKPVMEEKDRKLQQSKSFQSKSENGDLFAGRSNRKYYFSTKEAAIKDVKKSASTWLKQKQAVLCPDK